MKKVFVIVFCIFWFCFIFYNSTKPGDVSNVKSYDMLNKIRSEYRQLDGEQKKQYSTLPKTSREEKLNLLLRKNAHAFEYCVLAIVVSITFYVFGVKRKDASIYTLFICLLYAVLDEFHQLYVPGRTSSVRDVLIDFVGAIIGMALYLLVVRKRKDPRGM